MTRYLAALVGALTLVILGCGDSSVFACSEQGIRDAVAQGGGPNTFACDGPRIVVTAATIEINNDVVLDGGGNLILEAFSQHRVFSVAQNATVELRGMTVRGGLEGIFNVGTLTLIDSEVSGNNSAPRYPSVGGIYNDDGGILTLNDSTVSENNGGGILNVGTLTLNNSTVTENNGGGIRHWRGDMTLINSTVSANDSPSGSEFGGIYANGSSTLVNSSVSGNTGGGITGLGTMTLINSTVSGNSDDYSGGGISLGGFGSTTLINSTVSGNRAGREGGGIYQNQGDLTLIHCTVSDNVAEAGDALYVVRPSEYRSMFRSSLIMGDCVIQGELAVTSLGHNIESPGDSCGFDQSTDQVGIAEERLSLGSLADNGGPTMTHALVAGSLAIDVVPEEECLDADGDPLTTDQRGEPRPAGDGCDVGAFEVQP